VENGDSLGAARRLLKNSDSRSPKSETASGAQVTPAPGAAAREGETFQPCSVERLSSKRANRLRPDDGSQRQLQKQRLRWHRAAEV
jgi:hypothetical protein